MNFYEAKSYKSLLKKSLEIRSKSQKGQVNRLASFIKVHPSRLSQILRGSVDLSSEQAVGVAEYFGWDDLERDYFVLLHHYERAGTLELKKYYEKKLDKVRLESVDLSRVLPKNQEINEEARAIFYSSWKYIALSLLCDIPKFKSPTSLAVYLGISESEVRRIFNFLVSVGLNKQNENGSYELGMKRTHLESTSPLVSRHHANWRLKAIEKHERLNVEKELAYTGPMVLSEKAAEKIHGILIEAIKTCTDIAVAAPSEKLMALNIDWFEVR